MDAANAFRRVATRIAEPVLAALVIAVIGLVSLRANQPLLAPSLGTSALLQITSPTVPGARAWNIAAGQAVGIAAGLFGAFAAGAAAAPVFGAGHPLADGRVVAAVIATASTVVVQRLIRADCPAGGATAVILALGTETADVAGAVRMLLGILLVTALGEASRALVLRLRPADER